MYVLKNAYGKEKKLFVKDFINLSLILFETPKKYKSSTIYTVQYYQVYMNICQTNPLFFIFVVCEGRKIKRRLILSHRANTYFR